MDSSSGNPFKCNCLFDLFMLRLHAISVSSDINTCLKPVLDVGVQKNSYSQDLCSFSCTNNGNVAYIFVDCNSKTLATVPQFLRNNATDIEIISGQWYPLMRNPDRFNNFTDQISQFGYLPNATKSSIYTTFYIKDKVLGINLENNRLKSLEIVQFPPNLMQLYLSNNELRKLPSSILEDQRNLKEVTLSGNPWMCDCAAVKFRKWLTSEKEKIKDIGNVRCGVIGKETSRLHGRVIWNLTDHEICPTQLVLIISASSGALTFVLLCLAVKVSYTKYELSIKAYLYSHRLTFMKEADSDYHKIFDVFVSFSQEDGEFVVNDIVSAIERKDPNIRLCVHYRHFIAGEFIYRNIAQAIQNSKRTLVILSRSFLESEWCLFEFKTAYLQGLQDKVQRIILVKFGDLPKEIDPDVKMYLDSTTYLTWNENNFWNKLLYVLPSQCSDQNHAVNDTEENETVL